MYRDRSHAGLIGRNFLYLADGEALLEDLGSGEYTKKYFQMNAMKFSVHVEKVITCRSSVV